MAFSVSSNSPSVGHIAWSGVHLVYEGVDYSIANASTDKKFVYWLKAQPGTFQVSDTYPAISADDCIVFLNKGGVPISVLTATATDGDLVVPGTITSSAIATEAIDATHIKSDAIIARHILAGAITAEKLSVNELSAISANMGTMTAGNFTLNATGFIKGGASSYAAGNGFWMGYDGGYYKFRAGTPGSSRMEWNGTAFNIYGPDGSLTISSGVVDYTKLASKPQSLSDISSTEGQKLSTVQDGATRNVFRGDHAMGVTYVQGDLVLDASGYGWSCLQTHISDATNQPPTHPVESNAFWSIYIIRGADGADGVSGVNGTRTAVLEMYRWSAAAPTTFPSGTSTYTWATGQFTAPATVNGWSLTPPAPVAGQTLWVVRQAYADTATDATSAVTWTAASSRSLAAAGTNGSNGTRTAVLELYQWAASAPTSFPSGTSTYTWATGAFSAPTTSNGWSLAPGAAAPGQTLWGCSVSYADTGTSTTSTVTWNTTVTYALGAAGTNGANGANAKAAFVSATSQVFQVNKSAVASPTSITLTATGQNVTGSPSFAVTSGTATLTGTGNTRALAYSGMTTDTATVTMTWDGITDTITIVKVREGADGTVGADGTDGADGVSALTVVVSNEAHVFPASTTGTVSSYTGSGFTVQVYEGATALSASDSATTSAFRIGTIVQSPASTLTVGATSYAGTTATVAQHSAMVAGTDSVTLTIPITIYRADGSSTTVNKVQTLSKSKTGSTGSTGPTGPAGADGVGGIVAVLSNEAHVFPASSTGVVSSYVGSGTEIRVFEGATPLVYDGAGAANGTWTFTSSATNITRGTITDSGTFATVGAHSGVASGTDLSSITYTISGKSSSGASFSLSKAQSFSKSKTGADGATGPTGAPGPAVTITSSRETTFISTDAILDPDQTAISLTASTSGIESPTYVWTFSGFQTSPVASTSAIQVISPADFGTSKSAVVTCTVNGTHKDQVTIVRLERALETGAFRETFVSATNASVAADWQNYAGSGEVSVVSAPDGIGGNSLYIGNNSGDDQAWLIKKQKIPFDSNTLYRVSCRLRRRAGTGTIYIGLAGVAADGVTLINSTGSNTHSGQHYVAASAASPANSTSQWTTYVGYVKGETLSGVAGGGLANNITTPAKMYFGTRYVRPLILANYQSLAGTVEVDYFEVTPLPSTMAGIDQITSDNASTVIANAAIGSAQIGSVALVGTSNFSVKTAVSGARMEMDSRAIKVYDASGIKRIQIGDLTV